MLLKHSLAAVDRPGARSALEQTILRKRFVLLSLACGYMVRSAANGSGWIPWQAQIELREDGLVVPDGRHVDPAWSSQALFLKLTAEGWIAALELMEHSPASDEEEEIRSRFGVSQ